MPQMTNARAGIGCCSLLTLLGGFASGVYLGFNHEKGNLIGSPKLELLQFGPAVLGGVVGRFIGKDLVSDSETLNEFTARAPPNPMMTEEQKEGIIRGCFPTFSMASMAAVVGAVTWGGYALGRYLGRQ